MTQWWKEKRTISVVVDNDSWILPAAKKLVEACNQNGDRATLCRSHDEILSDGIAFYLGCVKITPPEILARNHLNLVIHASDLPKGRGMSPWTWLILEGAEKLPLCLLEAEQTVDSGAIIYKDWIHLNGQELVNDLRNNISEKTLELCLRFLSETTQPKGTPQEGAPSFYKKRSPADSKLNIYAPLINQFPLLRVVDNESYPAFFEINGQKYVLKIYKDESE